MSLQQWAITTGAKGIIKEAENDGRVAEAVTLAESTIKGFFPDDPKNIKIMFVQYCIMPFCRILLKEVPDEWQRIKKQSL